MEFEKLRDIIADILNLKPEEKEAKIKPDARFLEDLGADSLDVYQIVMEIESQFDIEIPNETLTEIKTVQDAVELLKVNK